MGDKSGSAYVYKKNGTEWIHQTKLVARDAAADNRFGIDVAISGDYIIIGAFFDDDFSARSGSACIFVRNGDLWTEQEILKADDGAADDWFGVSVAICGDFAAVGARYDDNEKGRDAGAVYIFQRDGNQWRQSQKITASDGAAEDLFHEVELAGDYLMVGAYRQTIKIAMVK